VQHLHESVRIKRFSSKKITTHTHANNENAGQLTGDKEPPPYVQAALPAAAVPVTTAAFLNSVLLAIDENIAMILLSNNPRSSHCFRLRAVDADDTACCFRACLLHLAA